MDDPAKTTPEPVAPVETTPETPARVKPVVEEIKPTDLTPEAAAANQSLDATPEVPAPSPQPTFTPPSSVAPPAPMDGGKKGSGLAPLIFAIVAFLVVALAGGIYVYMTGLGGEPTASPTPSPLSSPTSTPEASASPSASPDASPSGEVNLSKLKVNILNGSGKIGEATKVKTLLEKEGFKIASTGNAASFDFASTVIQTKESVEGSVVDLIEKALSGYTTEVGDALKASNTYDIVITVGSN